ncbi:MAG: UDP-N-acetylmuramyl-tripeptide synthetase [Patescibacteria group bacterium]
MRRALWLEIILKFGRQIIPRPIFRATQPIYHYLLAFLGSVIYRHPSRAIAVIFITGTKGKTTTSEVMNAIFEATGARTALANTIRIKIGDKSEPNKFKMTIQGRFFVQRFLRQAVEAHCRYAIIEMTSEGAKQFRHRFIEIDALIFTNLAPEHIESHGSYEKYLQAKLSIGRALARSRKPAPTLIVNGDDRVAKHFLALPISRIVVYRLRDASPYATTESGTNFTWRGKRIRTQLPGLFNLMNVLAGAVTADHFGATRTAIRRAVEGVTLVRGRMERVEAKSFNSLWPDFTVIVDYAHTPDSLREVYQTFAERGQIAVLGGTGGGRDTWKRPVMGTIASEHCRLIILTNEDPYDENPEAIVNDIVRGIKRTPYKIIMDRRLAIREALHEARAGEIVIITGKGTDPFIMGPKGTRIPWDDMAIVRDELKKLAPKS